MTSKISIHDVRMEWLNSRCLVQISKYAKTLHDHNQTVMNLRDEDILQQVTDHARNTQNLLLKEIYIDLKKEIKFCLSDPLLSTEIAEQSVPDYLVADNSSRVPNKELLSRWFRMGRD